MIFLNFHFWLIYLRAEYISGQRLQMTLGEAKGKKIVHHSML